MNARPGRSGTLAQAVVLHNRGALPEAARLYQRVLRESPRAFEPVFLLALLRVQQGDQPDAERRLRRALEINPRHSEAWFHLAEVLAASGRQGEADASYDEACRLDPPHALACFKVGLRRDGQGRAADARVAYERALTTQPDFPEALNNLANLLRAANDLDRAEALLRQAIAVRPDFDAAHVNLGSLLATDRDDPAAARKVLENAIRACPQSAQVEFHLAVLLAQAGEREQAIGRYERALTLDPNYAEAYNNVGVVFLEEGFLHQAQTCFERAVAFNPSLAEAYNNLGNLFTQLEQHEAARAAFEEAIALRPAFAEPHNGLGLLLAEMDDVESAAAHFRSALERRAAFPEAAANLGAAMQRLGEQDAARHWYQESLRLVPSLALRIKAATMLPPIPGSRDELLESRHRLERGIDELIAAGGRTTEYDLLKYPDTGFYLAYHGMNDRAILEKISRLYAQSCPTLLYRAPHMDRIRDTGRPTRIGFVSRFFCNHSVGNFFNPIIEHLARQPDFEVHLFSAGLRQDETLARVASACREHVVLSRRSLDVARKTIEARELDVLVYPDIGMDPFTYFLSFSRLAPVQCVLHGHSDTSGVPEVDYFVSSRLHEPDDAQTQYSERLVLLDELPMVLRDYPPLTRVPGRTQLGLPEGGRLYICPMKLHKIHPDMDDLVAGILRSDPQGHVAFFEDNRNASWATTLRARLSRRLSEEQQERLVFLPFATDLDRFRGVVAQADVVLDTPHHGGGTTCNICLSVGTPIVSLVGQTCRGRGPFIFYRLMGLSDGLTWTPEEYVTTAVAIAADPARRAALHSAILERYHRIRRNQEVLAAYAKLFRSMATGAPLPLAEPG